MTRLMTLIALFIFTPALVLAQSPSPTSIRDAVKEQVAQELAEIKQAVAKKAYVGSITTIDNLNLTITNLKNQSRTATVTTDTAIKLTGGKDGTSADLKVGLFVIAMGDVDSNGTMTAKRLLVISQPAEDKRQAIFATVTKASASTLTVEDLKKASWTIKLSSTTKYVGNTKTVADIEIGNKIVAVGTVTAENSLTAAIVNLVSAK
ncbi:MAG: DUF5666 domain-containing protein [bacterium]|nr:DUF5666 domain-containing protein [bacterium]